MGLVGVHVHPFVHRRIALGALHMRAPISDEVKSVANGSSKLFKKMPRFPIEWYCKDRDDPMVPVPS